METYDIIMLVVLGVAAFWGARKGFAWQVASIASIAVSYWVAMEFREPFSKQIDAEPPWNNFLAMFLLFSGTMLAIWMLFRTVSRTIDAWQLREFDRTLGAILGLAKGGIYCILITMFAVALLGDSAKAQIVHSKSGYFIAKFLDQSENVIPKEIHDVVGPHLKRLDEQLRAVDTSAQSRDSGGAWNRAGSATFPSAQSNQSPLANPQWSSSRSANPDESNSSPASNRQAELPSLPKRYDR